MNCFSDDTNLSGAHYLHGGKSGDARNHQDRRTGRTDSHAHRWPTQQHRTSKPIVPATIDALNLRRRPGQFVGAIVLTSMLSIGITTDGIARDGDFQSVLLKARCPSAKVETLSDSNDTVVYRANCFSSSHKIVTVVCIKGICSNAKRSSDDADDPG